MRSSTLSAYLLGNLLSGKRIVTAGYGSKQGKGIARAGYSASIKKALFHHIS